MPFQPMDPSSPWAQSQGGGGMIPGGLGGLAQGLRLAGGILSPRVFQTVAEEDKRREQQMQMQRMAEIQQTVKGIEMGAIPSEAGQMRLKQLGFEAPVGPGPEVAARQERAEQQRAMREAMAKLPANAPFEERIIAMAPHMPAELQLQAYTRIEGKREWLDLRKEQLQQAHEARLQGFTNQQQRDAETARHNAALETMRAEGINLRRMGGALNRGGGGKGKAPVGYRWTDEGDLEPIPGGPKDPASMPLKALPIAASKSLLENQQNLRRAEQALLLIEGKEAGGVKGDPAATGFKGYLPEAVLQRTDPGGVVTRAAIADLGSMIIHDRSGAAVTAAEYPRLRPFIPLVTDDAATAKKKLTRFVAEYKNIAAETADFYKESGYNVPTGTLRQAGPTAAPTAPGSGWSIQKIE